MCWFLHYRVVVWQSLTKWLKRCMRRWMFVSFESSDCPAMPEPFHALSLWYDFMPQASDEEVCTLLQKAWREHASMIQLAAKSAAYSAGR